MEHKYRAVKTFCGGKPWYVQEGNEMDKTFDEWWESLTPAEHKLIGQSTAKYVWTCAWTARQEKDAKIADSWDNGSSGNAAKVIARCIRAQGE